MLENSNSPYNSAPSSSQHRQPIYPIQNETEEKMASGKNGHDILCKTTELRA